MNEKKVKTPKSSIIKFIIVCMCCGAMGYISAKIVAGLDVNELKGTLVKMAPTLAIVDIVVYVVANVALFMATVIVYVKTKKTAMNWNGEDENVITKVEHDLSYPVLFTNLAMLLNMIMFGVTVELAMQKTIGKNQAIITMMVAIVILIIGMVWIVVMQNITINLEKSLNPEKRGNVFDANFQKEWESSCDEAQKLIIYQSGYTAFKRTTFTCSILWVVCIMAQMFFHTGLLPLFCVGIIYMVSNLSYILTAMKLEG